MISIPKKRKKKKKQDKAEVSTSKKKEKNLCVWKFLMDNDDFRGRRISNGYEGHNHIQVPLPLSSISCFL